VAAEQVDDHGGTVREGFDIPQEQPETPLELARRHVAEAEADVARQREILRKIDPDESPDLAWILQDVLTTMESKLAQLRDHLQFEERRADPSST
jgi:hypothetical protein